MTESEWSSCEDPGLLLEVAAGWSSGRKQAHFACAIARRLWGHAADADSLAGFATVEAHADGGQVLAPGAGLGGIASPLDGTYYSRPGPDLPPFVRAGSLVLPSQKVCLVEARAVFETVAAERAGVVAAVLASDRTRVCGGQMLFLTILAPRSAADSYRRWGPALARDIFGSRPGPVAFDPGWRTSDVLGLARGIYEEAAFDRLSLLADALMDAGCDEEGVFRHCRSDGPHVLGCWVVDLVLGKE